MAPHPHPETGESPQPNYFSCQLCGECCSSLLIPMEEEKAQVLLKKSWVQERLARFNRALKPLTGRFYQVPLTDMNVCVFLGEDKKCLIEVNESYELKPEDCKHFPFAGAILPDGQMAYDTSASCKTVAEQLLRKFQPVLPKPGTEPNLNSQPFPQKIPLSSFPWSPSLEFEEYTRFEEEIQSIFNQVEYNTPSALKQSWELLWGRASAFQPMVFSWGFPKLSEWWLPLLLLRKPYGTQSWVSLLFQREYADPKIFGQGVSIGYHQKIPIPTELDPLLKGFVYNILTRKVLLSHGHSLTGVFSIACAAYSLVRWYARILAHLAEKSTEYPVVEKEDMFMAIRLVERYYTGHQPYFLQSFQDFPKNSLAWFLLSQGKPKPDTFSSV